MYLYMILCVAPIVVLIVVHADQGPFSAEISLAPPKPQTKRPAAKAKREREKTFQTESESERVFLSFEVMNLYWNSARWTHESSVQGPLSSVRSDLRRKC